MNNITKGLLFALATAVISGFAIFYSKVSLAKIDPLVLTTSRNFYVGVIFLLFFLFSKRLHEIKKLKRNDLILLIIIGAIGGALPFYLFFSGLSQIPAITGNLIHKTLFIWVGILAVIFLREKLKPIHILSYLLIFLANSYFVKVTFSFGTGELMVLSATLFWATENIIAKKVLKNVSSELVALFRMGIGGLLLMATTLLTGKGTSFLTLDLNMLIVIFVGGSILFFYNYFWYKALKYAPASIATLLLTFSVVIGNVLNGSFAGVKITTDNIYSSIIIFAAIGIVIISYRIKSPRHAEFARLAAKRVSASSKSKK